MKLFLVTLFLLFATLNVHAEKADPDSIINQEPDLTIQDVISSPSDFNGSKILVQGVVQKAKHYTLINGKTYTAFEIADDDDNVIRVYKRGIIDGVEEGKDVRVYGKFSEEESYFFISFKNVLKAKKVLVLNTVVSGL